MNVYVIGLGSMGRRRIEILIKNNDISIFGIDINDDRRKEIEMIYKIKTLSSLNEIKQINENDCAFVCTSPLSHSEIINECLLRGLNVFSEINLLKNGYRRNIDLANRNNLKLFLSSTFLYRDEINYIINRVNNLITKADYIYHIGQYLPDWHPWENYKEFFVNDKKTNGCREILAIELPWITKCFGKIVSTNTLKDNISNLDINYDDNYLIQVKHENGNKGIIVVDIVSRKPVRKLDIFGEELYISWNGTTDSLYEYDIKEKQDKNIVFNRDSHKNNYADFISENPYQKEVDIFFETLDNDKRNVKWTFNEDLEILDIIDRIEE